MHALDRPVWASLGTCHTTLSEGGALAKRYARDVNLFASACDDGDEALAALAAFCQSGRKRPRTTSAGDRYPGGVAGDERSQGRADGGDPSHTRRNGRGRHLDAWRCRCARNAGLGQAHGTRTIPCPHPPHGRLYRHQDRRAIGSHGGRADEDAGLHRSQRRLHPPRFSWARIGEAFIGCRRREHRGSRRTAVPACVEDQLARHIA